MDARRVTVYVRVPSHQRPSNRTITVALEGVDADGQRELVDRGFVPKGDYALFEIVSNDPMRTRQILRELDQWIVIWADKHGTEPIFRWRVAPR